MLKIGFRSGDNLSDERTLAAAIKPLSQARSGYQDDGHWREVQYGLDYGERLGVRVAQG